MNLTAAIIAGGKSRRFGEPKALAKFGGKRMIDYAVDIAKQISPTIFISISEENLFADLGIPVAPDIIPNGGPLGGIYTALTIIKTPWLAVLPCDAPLLSPRIYSILYRRRGKNHPVAAVSENGLEPLVSIWPRSLSAPLKIALGKKQFAIHSVMKELNVVEIFIPEIMPGYRAEMFYNINRREDLEKL
jgi:molybdopterin-guanine dinucleotide biosynthesis protein A